MIIIDELLVIENPENEIWRDIEIPNIIKPQYQISNKGHVKNIKTDKILKPYLNKQNGYLYVTLPTTIHDYYTGNVVCKKYTIHRLVYDHFTTDPDKIYDKRYIVNHKDGNKLHCEDTNLEWVTYKGNANHALEHDLLLTGEKAVTCKTTEYTVRKICELLQDGKNYKEICDILNLEWNEYNKGLLVRIRLRTEWKSISKDYDFDSKSRLRRHSDEFIDTLCKGIDRGLTTGQLFALYGQDVPYSRFRKVVYNVRNRIIYKDISEKYSWWKQSSTTIDS